MASNSFPMIKESDQIRILKSVFGFDSFRAEQAQVIEANYQNRDAFVLWATGQGKSMCFQYPPLLWEENRRRGHKDHRKCVVVVSPLISLMQDQVNSINRRDSSKYKLSAIELSAGASQDAFAKAANGDYSVIFVTPERLFTSWSNTLEVMVRRGIVGLFAIDEVHCVSEWGHDFRPEFRQLGALRDRYPSVPILGLTATATHQVKEDVMQRLKMNNPLISFTTFNRENLIYHCKPKADLMRDIEKLVSDYKKGELDGVAVIYCMTKKDVDLYHKLLSHESRFGQLAQRYHAGMAPGSREMALHAFINDNAKVIVATVAFGMGIDKPDIRRVIHVGATKSIETYYQQTGRAGRDGLQSECFMYYSTGDFSSIKRINEHAWKDEFVANNEAFVKNTRRLVAEMQDYACLTLKCRRKKLLEYFGEAFNYDNCGGCDNCLNAENNFKEDIGTRLWQLLTLVSRMRGFGGGTYLKVICGSREKKMIEKYQVHTRYPDLHGAGKDRSMDWWKLFLEYVLQEGYLEQFQKQMNPGFAVRSVTLVRIPMKGSRFLNKFGNAESATLVVELPEKLKIKPKLAPAHGSSGRSSRTDASSYKYLTPEEHELFKALSAKNMELTEKAGLGGQKVTFKAALADMACVRPDSLLEMAPLYGMTTQFLNSYGQQFLQCIDANWQGDRNKLPHSVNIDARFDDKAKELFALLKKKRAEIQEDCGVNVISTRTLARLAMEKPSTEEIFGEVLGIDDLMAEFGDDKLLRFLKPIQDFCAKNNILAQSPVANLPLLNQNQCLKDLEGADMSPFLKSKISAQNQQTLDRLKGGETPEQIRMNYHGRKSEVQVSTIIGHVIPHCATSPLRTGLIEEILGRFQYIMTLSDDEVSDLFSYLAKLRIEEIQLGNIRRAMIELGHTMDYGVLNIYTLKFLYVKALGRLGMYKKGNRPRSAKRKLSSLGGPPAKKVCTSPANSSSPSIKKSPKKPRFGNKNSTPGAKFVKPSPVGKKKPVFGDKRKTPVFGGKKTPSKSPFGSGKKTVGGTTSFGGAKKPTFGSAKKPVFGNTKKSPFSITKKSPFSNAKRSSFSSTKKKASTFASKTTPSGKVVFGGKRKTPNSTKASPKPKLSWPKNTKSNKLVFSAKKTGSTLRKPVFGSGSKKKTTSPFKKSTPKPFSSASKESSGSLKKKKLVFGRKSLTKSPQVKE